MGIHLYDIDLPVDYSPLMEAWWFSLLFYVLSLAITKVSICLLYLTIFTLPWARRACYLVLAIVVLTSLFSVAATLTDCIPLQAVWDPTVTPSFCQPQDTCCVIATDWMIFILPIPMVLPLKLPTRQKLIVVGVFAVGFFVCLVSLIRLVILIRTEAPGAGPDFTYIGADLLYWTVIEVHTAIVVACAMTLKPLAARLFPRLLADSPPRDTLQTSDLNTTVGHASGGRPPTIGSRPARAAAGEYMAQVRGKLGGEGGRIGDVEAAVRGAAGREDGKRDTSGLELLPGSSPGSESSTIGKTDAEVVALVLRSSWMK
ncbi:37d108eb-37b2-4796-9c70-add19dfb0ca6 [Thermothielavioides terrestris]|uniref:37d108eb-37b2-4796-9c70-add19dfb0ca6 n=1 Tax=Thermothielavioides terrestris TaxID=2587410 RepID=A0A446BSI3_9PEZI|nr:37d108eb-37b2-4796-9c70-add19dfb0ca6 [Thermothielavioides terrestris]